MCSLVAVSIRIGLPCPGSASIIHHARKTTNQPGRANLNGKRPTPCMRLYPRFRFWQEFGMQFGYLAELGPRLKYLSKKFAEAFN
ncbi:uncharacterized protein LOC128257514 [Drosophila gunungcola]|uniref:Uncharacterized protein n=1 Tax=Drosophila gunungcola TaxID=103775 RepID=A0A9P9YR93_9MUSC|nr:uncharacterized protein LOC128257514 [Drosophila gunungcola]KAI8041443.1 hypothetical protein M5D96_005702 [Drosophila gunungcola]